MCYTFNMRNKAFTLIELLIVVVIVGVIATFVMPSFSNSKEKSRNTEAATALQSVKAAERMYRLKNDTDQYVLCGPTADCETKLGMDLAGDGSWDYAVALTAAGFDATATRNPGATRTWTVKESTEPVCTGTGC